MPHIKRFSAFDSCIYKHELSVINLLYYLSGAAHFHCCSRLAVVSSRPEEDSGANRVPAAAGDRLQARAVQHPADDHGLQCMAAPCLEGCHNLRSWPHHPFHVQRPR
jgi:hypothetical protein